MATIDKWRKMVHSWPFLKKSVYIVRAKLEKNLGSISDMSRLPAALFVDIKAEHIAIKEAQN
jgi:small subunit ribosomal protein S2